MIILSHGLTTNKTVVATSSTEAEHVIMSDACTEDLALYCDLGESVHVALPMHIRMDNQGPMFTANNFITSSRSNHIDLLYHII